MSETTETITFQWTRQFGDCYECGLPAAYHVVDAHGPGRSMLACCVCAAVNASEGLTIRRCDQPLLDEVDVDRDTLWELFCYADQIQRAAAIKCLEVQA